MLIVPCAWRIIRVPVGETYVFNVKTKSRSFEFAPQVVTVNEDFADLNFTGW